MPTRAIQENANCLYSLLLVNKVASFQETFMTRTNPIMINKKINDLVQLSLYTDSEPVFWP